jgi:hypothetical protein
MKLAARLLPTRGGAFAETFYGLSALEENSLSSRRFYFNASWYKFLIHFFRL